MSMNSERPIGATSPSDASAPIARTFATESPMSPSSSRREGFALAIAMIAIVAIGALIAGAFFTSTQEFRVSRNQLWDQRAFNAAEVGVTQPIEGWLKTLNLEVATGETIKPDTFQIPNSGGAYAVRRVTKLDDYTFWIMSDGYSGGVTGSLASHHRVNAIYRLAYASFTVLGALTVRGQVTVGGSSRVDGTDIVPPTWTGAGICPAPGPGLSGVSAPDTTLVCNGSNCPEANNTEQRIFGYPAQSEDPRAADPNTYFKYGDQTWTMLTANADIRLPGGNYKTLPTLTPGGKCDFGNDKNWGDPERTVVPACANYFPIVYITGNLKIQSNSRAQGILLVDGDIEMQGGFEFRGIMIARDDIRSTGNGNKVMGTVMAGNTYVTDNSSVSGDAEISYSSCAVDRAARGAAAIVRARERGWSEILAQ